MKKKILVLSLVSVLFFGGVVGAASINGDYKGNPIVKVRVNGNLVDSEVPAQIVDGSTLLPLRAVSQALGAEINWNANNYSADVKLQNTSNADLVKRYVALADHYIAMQEIVQFARGFVGVTDRYIQRWNNNEPNKISDDTLAQEYQLNYTKAKELEEKSNKAYPYINLPELNKTNDILARLYALLKEVDGTYKGAYGWKYAKIDSGSVEIGQEYLIEYRQASQKLLDDAQRVLDEIKVEYQTHISNALNK